MKKDKTTEEREIQLGDKVYTVHVRKNVVRGPKCEYCNGSGKATWRLVTKKKSPRITKIEVKTCGYCGGFGHSGCVEWAPEIGGPYVISEIITMGEPGNVELAYSSKRGPYRIQKERIFHTRTAAVAKATELAEKLNEEERKAKHV